MNIRLFLLGHGGFPNDRTTIRAVVVTHEKTRLIRQGEHFLNAVVQLFCRAPRKITTGRAAIGHEQGVADKSRVAHHMDHAGGSVAGRIHRESLHIANHVSVAIIKKCIKLAAIALEFGAFVENFAERVLNNRDLGPNANFTAQFLLYVRCSA